MRKSGLIEFIKSKITQSENGKVEFKPSSYLILKNRHFVLHHVREPSLVFV